MKQHAKYPFILFFLSLSTLLFGQFTAPRFQRLTIADGLPNGEVDQIREDAEGFIWFSTSDGICRFDGYKMQTLTGSNPEMTAALNADRPVFFDWDAQKRWWIGSDWAGMRRFDPPKKEFRYLLAPFYGAFYGDKYKNLDTLDNASISSILSDGDNRVWIGTEQGLAVFDIGKDRLDRNPQLATPLFKGNKVQQISKDATGNIWALVRTKGLYRFDKTTQTWSTAVGHNDIRHFTFDKEGNIFFVASKELWQYNPKTKAKTQPFGAITKALTTKSEFFKIHQDKKGRLWLGTNSGLILLRGGKIPPQVFHQDPRNPYSLLSNFISAIFEDSKENIWLACGADGVCMLPYSFERIQTFDNPTTTHSVEGVVVGADSTLYALTLTHLLISHPPFYKTEFIPISDFIKCPNPLASKLVVDTKGNLYIGTECGIWQYQPRSKQARQVIVPPSDGKEIKGRGLLSLNIWGDTLLTFNRFNEEGMNVFNLKTGHCRKMNAAALVQNIIFTNGMIRDKSGEFWSNSYAGLIKMGNFLKSIDTFRYACFYFGWKNYDDRKNGGTPLIQIGDNLWWGKADGGGLSVMSLRDTAYNSFLKQNGLYDNSVYTLVHEKSGYLWAGTSLGISRIQLPTDFRTTRQLNVHNFSTSDGLPHNTVLCSTINLSGDKVFVGTVGGLAVVNTEGTPSDTISPKLVFTNLSILNKTVYPDDITGLLKTDINNTEKLTLQHNQAFFTLEVSGLNFVNPQLTRYAYRLSGLNGDWIDNGFNNIIAFNNIAAGLYTLEVKAQTNTGLWSAPKTLTIQVLEPIWKRTWFILLCVLAFLGVVYGAYRYRLNEILSVQNLKNTIASDLHDDVGATLSNVNILTTLVRQRLPNDVDVLPLLKRIEEEITSSSESLDDIIWSVNPQNDSMERVLSRMRQFANEVFDAKDIEGHIVFDKNLSSLSLPMEKRRDFYLIYKEAVNNLAKYANCKEANISLTEAEGKLVLVIKDNGIGFDPLSKKDRNGQKTMRQRAEKLNAELNIQSTLGSGTTIELHLPLA